MAIEGVLRTRLLPPRLPPGCVPREQLVTAVEEGLRGRLVAVVAGAGYGKTTLLVLALERSESPWVWCSCDAGLADTRMLLVHLAAGLTGRFPGFGAGLELEGSSEEQVVEVCNEVLDTVPEECVVALDDVHLLPPPAAESLGLLVEHLPPSVHLALAGRMPLPLPLARLRAARVVEIEEGQLAFSLVEAAELVRSVGLELDQEALVHLHRRTEGWPAGLILAALSGEAISEGTPSRAEFDYLAEEVLGRQPTDLQELLLDTAVLGRFSPDLAAAVSGRPDAGELVRRLAAGHLFTARLDDSGDWYRYHHLFQAFLRRRLSDRDPERARERHRRAAAWWQAAGDPAEAVPHFLQAGELDEAVDALEPVAERLALSAHAESLAGWLERIPRERWAARPGLLLAEASLLLASARHEAAFADFERAIERLATAGDHERAAAALFRMQQAMLAAGTSPSRRIEAGRRWRERIAADAALLPAARILLASAYAYGCRFAEAEEEFQSALSLPAARGSPVLPLYARITRAFYVDFWLGRPHDALAELERAQAELAAREAEDALLFLPFAEVLRSYLLNELGRHDDALSAARHIQEDLDRRGLGRAIGRSRTWVDTTALAGLGRWDELAATLVAPPVAVEAEAPTSYSYRYRAPWARLAGHRGDAGEVRRQVAAAQQEMRAFGVAFDDYSFLCVFALAAADADLPELAREQADDAVAAAGALGSSWARGCAAVVAAWCHLGEPAGDDRLAEALQLTRRADLPDLWIWRYRTLAGPLLARALAPALGPVGEAERLLAACGGDVFADAVKASGGEDAAVRARLAAAAGEAADVDLELVDRLLRDRDPVVREAARRSWSRLKARPRAAIQLVTLGDFRVLRDGVVVAPATFVRQKARALLGALLAAGGPVHRETLCEWLWPDLAPERAAAALRSTLHDLRRAVEPELEAGSASSLVVADGDVVRLVLSERDTWDAAAFLALAAPAKGPGDDELARLLRAENLYGGPFLPEWPFDDWAAPRRVDLEEAFKGLLDRLAAALVGAGRPREAVSRYRRLLQMESEREGWHRDLMRAHAAAGERALALRQYHACRTILRREQGIEPDPETRALYQALLQEEPLGSAL